MRKRLLGLFCSLLLIQSACKSDHFIKENDYREQVETDFIAKQAALPNGNLFNIFEHEMSIPEREALMFLYAYMPIGDVTDYSGEFYLNNVRQSFRTRDEMPWGNKIPDSFFRHFVLPIRINNENLDRSREVFYQELKDRVKNKSLYDAILEVNHWCHEKMIYEPSDSRTSAPLASVRTASGRCGEESTLLVAALRSVGIPARQVYTPRWAHTDDNHAWVEAWADGRWYFLGACEPEPVLNLGWFNAPASRGMLMHTKVFGRYDGPEEIMNQNDNFTEINVIGNYAPTTHASVTVIDRQGEPVADASVEFKLYNYAEFYTVATKQSDRNGHASLTAGKGDLLVWASKNGAFGFGKLSLVSDSSVIITLDKTAGENYTFPLDIKPPKENPLNVPVTPEQRTENDRRLQEEDSIRKNYTSTFLSTKQAANIARSLQLDSADVIPILIASRGNHADIVRFLTSVSSEKRKLAIRLLQVISTKDLRDTPAEFLADHLNQTTPADSSPRFYRNVLNPRIANELITPYRSFFKDTIPESQAEIFRKNPQLLVEWSRNAIEINDLLNVQQIPMSPIGVWKARVADRLSRDIFFVAMARSLGIPAWIDEVTGKIQYEEPETGLVSDVDFEKSDANPSVPGRLTARYQQTGPLDNPKYYLHFTLSKFDNGSFRLLNYEEGDTDMGNGSNWKQLLKNGTALDPGYYLMVTGTRMASGNVLSQLAFFNIEPDQETTIDLVMREDKNQVQVIGNFNSEAQFMTTTGKKQSILQTTGRGYFIVAVLGANQEPTNHALRDISVLASEFEHWGREMVLLFPSEKQLKAYRPQEFPNLPKNIVYGVDINNEIQQSITRSMKLTGGESLPIFIIADTFNRVVFVSQGYTIGLGEQLMKVIHGL